MMGDGMQFSHNVIPNVPRRLSLDGHINGFQTSHQFTDVRLEPLAGGDNWTSGDGH
jgi:hypothetical protein